MSLIAFSANPLRQNVAFNPEAAMAGGYLPLDGTVEFFGRVRALLKSSDVVLDLGAGRGSWYFDDKCEYRRSLRDLKQCARTVYGADIDPSVLGNPTTTRNLLIVDGRIPLPDLSVDVIVADYVFEHVENPAQFCRETSRVLKPAGYLCARTPHKLCYVSVAARLLGYRSHIALISAAQPRRSASDIFPTAYRLNTMDDISRHFSTFENYGYLYRSEPQYFFGHPLIYRLLRGLQRLMPDVFSANIFAFLRKPAAADAGLNRNGNSP